MELVDLQDKMIWKVNPAGHDHQIEDEADANIEEVIDLGDQGLHENTIMKDYLRIRLAEQFEEFEKIAKFWLEIISDNTREEELMRNLLVNQKFERRIREGLRRIIFISSQISH
ncbi:hypothetical protein BY996DRAFT_6590911 [Phakopsora pachyrhizi]|nr:hypothetical protein BY996DRAFT_6590911 [Phakopsora pachyrhizi]